MHLNIALAQELAGTAGHFGKTYVYPSQDTLVAALARHHGQHISRRTLCRHLASLEAAGWVRRVRRHQHKPGIGWQFRSTLYVLLGPLWKMVKRLKKAIGLVNGWSRVTRMAHNHTPSGLRSPGGVPPGPPPERQKVAAANFAAAAREILHKN